MPIFRGKSVKIYTSQKPKKIYTDTVRGVRDKYQVWWNDDDEAACLESTWGG